MAAAFAGVLAGDNCKTQLINFLQRHLKQSISKADITYNVTKFSGTTTCQATITLNCLGGMQLAGNVASSAKEAEQQAAEQALNHHMTQIMALGDEPAAKKGKKRKAADGAGATVVAGAPVIPGAQRGNNKQLLNTALSRILRRSMTKEDIVIVVSQVPGGFQATCQLPSLPAEWAALAWAGEVDVSQGTAEDHAARYALAALQADETYGPIATGAAPAKKPKTKAAPVAAVGPVAAAGAAAQAWAAAATGTATAAAPRSTGSLVTPPTAATIARSAQLAAGIHAPAKGKGKSKVKVPREKKEPIGPLPRERISEAPVTGKVVSWLHRGFGWLELDEKVEHEAAAKNKGKVYLHKSDWTGAEPPQKDQTVLFHLYADSSGLGAEGAQAA